MVSVISNNEDLVNVYRNDHKKLVVLEFMVPWSELCKFMNRAVEELAKKYENDAGFYTLDTDKFKEQAREKGVEVLPTFLLLKDGKECKRIVGINKEELDNSIQEHKGGPDKGAPVMHPTIQSPSAIQSPPVTHPIVQAAPAMPPRRIVMPRGRRSRYPFPFSGWGQYRL